MFGGFFKGSGLSNYSVARELKAYPDGGADTALATCVMLFLGVLWSRQDPRDVLGAKRAGGKEGPYTAPVCALGLSKKEAPQLPACE